MAIRISVTPLGRRTGDLRHWTDHVVGHEHEHLVAVLQQRRAGRQLAEAEAHQVRDAGSGGVLDGLHRPADPGRMQADLHDGDLGGRVAPDFDLLLGDQVAQHPIGRPAHRRDGRDAQPLVHLGPLGVVDAGDDSFDAKRLPRHPSRDDVRVVARGHRGERVGPFNAGVDEHVAVEAHAGDRVAGELAAEAAERVRVDVDHGNRMSAMLEALREGRADPPAPHDDHVHWRRPPTSPNEASNKRSMACPAANGGCDPAGEYGGAPVRLGVVARPTSVLKRLLVGRPFRSDRLQHTLLPKRIALPVFASDALSSVAYAPDEILLTLSVAGATWLAFSPWIAIAVAVVMLTVVASYRQNVHAYPSGGGDYEVASVNLGPRFGLAVASALLVDYVLTVAVSTASGVANLGSVVPWVAEHKVAISVISIFVLTSMNLRGIRESGAAFAIPTYGFMIVILGMVATGLIRIFVLGQDLRAPSAGLVVTKEH